jgi:phage protein D
MSAPGVAGAIVTVTGRQTDPTVAAKLVDAIVDCQLRMPDRLTLRYRDFDLALVDGKTFPVGATLEVALGGAESSGVATVFDGLITGLEPEFSDQGVALVVCAMDRSQLLQRTPQTATYHQMSYGEIAAELAERAGLAPEQVSPGLRLPFVQQSNETDWDFLWRLAIEVDYHVRVVGSTLRFSPAGTLDASVTRLTWGQSLLAFRPRVSGIQQVEEVTVRGWDPTSATAIEASASAPTPESRMGISRETIVEAMGSGQASIVDRPVMSQDHAESIASSIAAQLASVFIEGDGTAQGTPQLATGAQVHIGGVGKAFSGTYALTGVRHRYRARAGYRTDFSICGRAHRDLLGLTRAPERPGWQRRIAVGIVTDKSDPEALGRVRVRYPSLGEAHEGWWARVLAPGSGAGRGFFSLPQVGDEVLVAFEHEGDQHPYVLGSVFNGPGAPGAVVQPDGAFTLATPQHIMIEAAKKAEITTAETFTVTSSGTAKLTTKPSQDGDAQEPASGGPPGDIQLDAKGALSLSGDGATSISAGTSATLSAKAGLTLSGGQQLQIGADGTVEITGATISIKASQIILG